MPDIRIGFIGAGSNARNAHLGRLLRRDPQDFVIVAAADPSEAARKAFAEKAAEGGLSPSMYDDYREMLDKEQLDSVVLSTPHTLHFEQISAALDAGLHVLAEKPMVCSSEHAVAVAEKCKATGRHVVVAYQRRFEAEFRSMKQFIHDPAFGKLHMVAAFQSQAWLWGTKGSWRQDPRLSGGGQLNDSGSHIIDVINWMLPAPVTEVSAMVDNRGTEVDIDSTICFRTADGALGSLSILGSAVHKGMCEDITLSGDGGRAMYVRSGYGEKIVQVSKALREPLTALAETDGVTSSSPDEHFLEVIRGETENQSTPESFLNVIRFTEACWKSGAQGGKPVTIA